MSRLMMTRRSLLLGASAAAALPRAAFAQKFPDKPVTVVIPFAAGGSTDVLARIIGEKMGEFLGQTVIIENRPGAGGNLGAAAVAKATPDGYTLLMGTISTHTLNPIMAKTKPYDPVADFTPVSHLVDVPNVLVVHPSLGVENVKDLIELLKKEPDKHNYASSGIGTPLHVSGELFKSLTGTNMKHSPYKGAGPAMNDLIGGHVKIMFDNLPSSAPFIRDGKIKALAVTVKNRVTGFDIPTMIEAGVPGYETYSWNALFAPAGTPKDTIAVLNEAANKAVKDAKVGARLTELSATVVTSTPEALAAHVKSQLATWEPVIKNAGITLN